MLERHTLIAWQTIPILVFVEPKFGVFAGLVIGVATVVVMALTHSTIKTLMPFLPSEMNDINVGSVALALNIIVTIAVSAATRPAAAPAPVGSA